MDIGVVFFQNLRNKDFFKSFNFAGAKFSLDCAGSCKAYARPFKKMIFGLGFGGGKNHFFELE